MFRRPLVAWNSRIDFERAMRHALTDLGEVLFRNRKDRIDRFDLRDRYDRVVGVGLNQIPGMCLQIAGTPVDRRTNFRILQIEARALDRRAIRRDRRRHARSLGECLVVLLT